MGQVVLLVVAAAWAAVLVPPLLRSRIENRPNSSVSDFRDQLSSLQRAMPARGVAMRSMARPLAQSPLSRPAAAGRPGMRGTGRTHGGTAARLNQPVVRRRPEPVRTYDATPRTRTHAATVARQTANRRDVLKRRRANVLFVLGLTAACALFLAATTGAQAVLAIAVIAIAALLGYVYVLGLQRQRELERELRASERAIERQAAPPARREPAPREARRQTGRRHTPRDTGQVRRQPVTSRWSHAV
jgi:Flp pilus assembly protein TadB